MKVPISYEIVYTLERVLDIINYSKETGFFCYDLETVGAEDDETDKPALNKNKCIPTLISISVQPGYSYIVPLFHEESPFKQVDLDVIFLILNSAFGDDKITKIAHNAKFDLFILRRYGVTEFKGRFVDTIKMHDVLDENSKHGLKILVAYYFPNYKGYDKGVKYDGELDQLAEYAAYDTIFEIALYVLFEDWLLDELELYRNFRNIGSAFLLPAFEAEYNGATIDKYSLKESLEKAEKALIKMDADLRKDKRLIKHEKRTKKIEIEKAVKVYEDKFNKYVEKYGIDHRYAQNQLDKITEIYSGQIVVYDEINFGSWQQMQNFLYDKKTLDLPVKVDRFTKEISRPTDQKYLSLFDDPFLKAYAEFKKMQKVISTYLKGILARLHNGKIHTRFNLAGAKTGRISSSNPNLQNMPRSLNGKVGPIAEAYKAVKTAFIPRAHDRKIIQCDFSQMEIRLIANFSGDENLINAYNNGIDVHALTGWKICSLLEGEITFEDFFDSEHYREYRQIAKSANFGRLYKISDTGYIEYVRNQTGKTITMRENEVHKNAIFKTYSKLLTWHKDYERRVIKKGYVKTWFGRKRRLDDINSRTNFKREKAIRDAINSPIQGTGGEYTLFVGALAFHVLPRRCIFFNTIHDSLKHDILDYDEKFYIRTMTELAENPPLKEYFKKEWGPVKMKMDFESSSDNWGSLQSVNI